MGLRRVGELLLQNVRTSDIVGRLGGDEFGIVLTHAEFVDGQTKAARLEALISAIVVRDADDASGESVTLGASCGTVEWRHGRTAASLIDEADETMFRAKNERKQAQ